MWRYTEHNIKEYENVRVKCKKSDLSAEFAYYGKMSTGQLAKALLASVRMEFNEIGLVKDKRVKHCQTAHMNNEFHIGSYVFGGLTKG